MKSYQDLEIFQLAKKLAIEIHGMTIKLPRYELYEEGGQIRRSSKAVASAIVEGYGRKKYKNDFIWYRVIAHAECDETIVHLDFLYETNSLTDQLFFHDIRNQYILLSKKLHAYLNWIEQNWKEGTTQKPFQQPATCLCFRHPIQS